MPTSTEEKTYEVLDLSGSVQRATTKFQRKANQADLSFNADYSRVGGVGKIKGYDRLGNTITTSSTSSSTTTTTSTSSSSSSTTTTSTSTSSSSSTSTSTTSSTTTAAQ